MSKLRLLIIILVCTSMFIFIQALIYGLLDNWDILVYLKLIKYKKVHPETRRNKEIKDAVSEFLNACAKMKLEVTLIDQNILEHLGERLNNFVKDKKVAADGHGRCHYFCSQTSITFGMFKPVFIQKEEWEKFSELLSIMNFKTLLINGPDNRNAKLERSEKFPLIPAHAVFFRKRAIIHVVIFHKREEQIWSATCLLERPNVKSLFFWRYLKRSPFCNNQHILPKIQSTTTSLDGLPVLVPRYLNSFLSSIKSSTFINCDLRRARKFYSKYGFDESSDAEVFRVKARTLLSDVKRTLDRLGVPFWLSSGTCLGWFRQCDFIPHSKDVDIGIWIKDYKPEISTELQNVGLVPKHIFGKVEDSFELSFRTPSNDLKLDIFFFYEEGDVMWNGGTQAKTGKKFKYRFPKFSLCWTEFVEIFVRVPCNTIEYIQANYGTNWNVLIKEWDWKRSPSNVEENGQWSSQEISQVVQVFQ